MRSAGAAPPEPHFSPLSPCSPRCFFRPREAPGAHRVPAAAKLALHEVGGKEEPRASGDPEAGLNEGVSPPEEEGLERRGGVKTGGGTVLSNGWGLARVVGLWRRAKGVTGWALNPDVDSWAGETKGDPAVARTRWAPPERSVARSWRAYKQREARPVPGGGGEAGRGRALKATGARTEPPAGRWPAIII